MHTRFRVSTVIAMGSEEGGRFLLELYRKATSLPEKELYQYFLDHAVNVTKSKIGFFHFVSKDQKSIILTTWNREALRTCSANYSSHYPIEQAGNWADCVRLRHPIIYNDFSLSPNRKGLPEGHVAVNRLLSIPIMEGGKVDAIFGVGNKAEPYVENDVVQLDLVAHELNKILRQRITERELHDASEKYSSLFANMLDGFAYCEMIFDKQHKPVDFVYLEVNDAFERLTGLKKEIVVGKKVTEVIPGIERVHPELFEIYGRVALTGKEERFEIFFEPLSIWLAVSVYCPKKGYFAAVFEDITERKKAEEALRKLNRHLRAISDSNQALMHATDEASLMQEICDIIINDCSYALVWIGFAEDDLYKTVRPVAFAGFDKGYIDALRVTWDERSERGRGPTGTVIRTGKPYICNMKADINFEPWRPEAYRRGYTASLVLPLISFENKTFGALNIYSKESNPFTDEEVKLLSELSNDFAYGIIMLRLRKEREQAEETLRKQASLINLSPDAIITKKMDDTITFWSEGAQKLYGWNKEEAIAQKTSAL